MDPKLQSLLNRQLSAELETSNLYAAMCAACLGRADLGAAQFFAQKSREELDHRRLVFSYLYSRGAEIEVGAVADQSHRVPPSSDLESVLDAFLAAERRTTALLRECWQCSEDAGDVRASVFLEGMLQEQTEEELEAAELCAQCRRFAGAEPLTFDHLMRGKSSAPAQTELATALGVRMVL